MNLKADTAACVSRWLEHNDYWRGRVVEQYTSMFEDPIWADEFWLLIADLVVTDYCIFTKPEAAQNTAYHHELVGAVAEEIEAADRKHLVQELNRDGMHP